MDLKFLKETVENIKMPDGMQEEIIRNCESAKKFRPSYTIMYRAVAAVLVVAILVTSVVIWKPWDSATVYAQDLMKGIMPNKVAAKEPEDAWIQSVADFSIELFKNGQTTDENSLISPMSVYLALAMTANGAGGETREAFQEVLGNGMSIDEINVHAYSWLNRLCGEEQETLALYNSIWFDEKNCGRVYPEFLQKNADYYGAGAFQMNFEDTDSAVKKVNNWISKATDGEIQKMLETIEPNTAMMLVNTILFESRWKQTYLMPETQPFQNANGEWVKAQMLVGEKSYIENENATGFILPYADEKYSFVALLPNEDISLEAYVANLTGEEFLEIVNLDTQETCLSYLPEFEYEYEVDLADALKDMGLESACNESSDFSNISDKGKDGMLYLDQVTHKTFIYVDKQKTRAGAATVETIPVRDAVWYEGPNYVILNRPFLYAIIDNETELPVFLGTVNQLDGEPTDAPDYGTYLQEMDGVTYRITDSVTSYASVAHIPEGMQKATILYVMPHGVSKIESSAAAGNETLEEVKIFCSAYGVLQIESGAFSNCPNLKKVFFKCMDGGVRADIADDAFEGSEQVVFYLPENDIALREEPGSACHYAFTHNIPVEFYDPSGKSYEISDVIYHVSVDEEIVISGVEEDAQHITISNRAPEELPNQPVISMNGFSCAENETLEQVEFHITNASEFVIQESAFSYCPNLKKIYFYGDYRNWMTIEYDVFEDSEQVVFYLPVGDSDSNVYQYAIDHGIPVEYYEE